MMRRVFRVFAATSLVLGGCQSPGNAFATTGLTDTTGLPGDSGLDTNAEDESADASSTAGDGDATAGDGDGTSSAGDGDGTSSAGDGDGTSSAGDGDGTSSAGDGDGTSSTGDGDGTTSAGDGDGTTTAGDGDGDGDGTTTAGDGDGDGDGAPSLLAFVTSTQFEGDFGGVSGGNSICRARATAGGYSGWFKAWLSDGTNGPAQRFNGGLRYTRVDGTEIASDLADLVDGTLAAAVDQDEYGAYQGDYVWTGTTATGGADPGIPICNDWRVDIGPDGGVGDPDATDGTWSEATQVGCHVMLGLYCFEQDVPMAPADHRRVFVTTQRTTGDFGGAAAADTTCNDLAAAAGLPGTYKAWISDTTTEPATSFSAADVPYALVNGEVIASDWADFTDGAFARPVNMNENGGNVSFPRIWSNTNPDGTRDASAPSCADWTSTANVGRSGDAMDEASWTDDLLVLCDGTSQVGQLRFLCVQQ